MKTSIIILSYNDYEGTTGQCLAALSSDPDSASWQLIVVDNGSDAATRDALRAAQQRISALRVVFNEKNLGFAAGNNVGIRLAAGDVVVLLNSDTIAPPGTIGRLAARFQSDDILGMIGPVTNAAGNEQGIYTTAPSVEGKIEEGLRYANRGGPEALDAHRLDFFCVAISRKALDRVGLLDEGFGRGYYEDFDYSLRVRQSGLKLAVAEDVFVYHRGGGTFANMPAEARELLKRNKRRIVRKHGPDVYFPHARDGNLAILAQYAERKVRGETAPEYRILNRLEYARSNTPRSWLKRWRYLRRVRQVAKRLGIEAGS
jgi:GT2 family glycosyltransferase